MLVLVAGASGLIGTELVARLRSAGHGVRTLTRGAPEAPGAHRWDPATGRLDPEVLSGVDAVVNLAGASLARLPWTPHHRERILRSRLDATATLTWALARTSLPPRTLLNASAVGYYGDRPGEELDESSPAGSGFLAEVVERWEEAARQAPDGTRVVLLRTGLVVGRGGALRPLELLTRAGLGARIGAGRQHWPWISLADEARAIVHLLGSPLAGPVGLEGPTPATAAEVTAALARTLRRPHALAVPAAVIRTALGEAGRELLLADQRAVPRRLLDDGFVFTHRTVAEAIRASWGAGRA
ncbi:MAG: TIGR01777 family oxidoreductase [Microbacteriaceae bacterium]